MKLFDRVNTPDGVGTIVNIECVWRCSFNRYGVQHDTYPANRVPGMFTNDTLYYQAEELTVIASDAAA